MGRGPMMMTATAFFDGPVGSVSPRAEDAFFGGIKLGNDTFKLTSGGRLADLDAWLLTVLGRALLLFATFEFRDIADDC